MSIIGSETAHFGFTSSEQSGLVRNPQGEGQDANSATQQGNGLDKAAAAVETWLRGALKRNPSSQFGGFRTQPEQAGDLIELRDTASDDETPVVGDATNLMEALSIENSGRSGRNDGDGTVRGRIVGAGVKGGKHD